MEQLTMCWDIAADRTLLGDVRSMVRRTLAVWEVTGADDLVEDIVLATSEMLNNAVLYGAPPIRLVMRLTGETLYAEVTDHGAGVPEQVASDQDSEHGRGLAIVDALCDQWGVEAGEDGIAKTVWFRRTCRRPTL